ncbi:MAG: hypothetical protein R6W70_02350 [bacterium]
MRDGYNHKDKVLKSDKKHSKHFSPGQKPKKQWEGYENPLWHKKDRKKVTILYSMVERRKSYFLRGYFDRHGYKYKDLGDHIREDVSWGKSYGNRMECNPMYFTSGSLIRNLMKIHKETGMSKEEIVEKFVFVAGGGQCGPCRYGMYPQEYLKVANDAGFKGFRVLIFGSEINQKPMPRESAFQFNVVFRINLITAVILADFMHIAECALRPYAENKQHALTVIRDAEHMLLEAFRNRLFMLKLPKVLRKVSAMFAKIPRRNKKLPLIFMTGEIFANLAHNDGNYNMRRFIMDEGCEVMPGLFTQPALYDNCRRVREAERGMKYAAGKKDYRYWKKSRKQQIISSSIIKWIYRHLRKAFSPEAFGGRAELCDLEHLAEKAQDMYHPEIFGGEGNLEIAEALHFADKVDGFLSSKPFGCMPSSGVSDGVQAKVMSMFPDMNFLSIETSGDNEASILSRVSMMLFRAKQRAAQRK